MFTSLPQSLGETKAELLRNNCIWATRTKRGQPESEDMSVCHGLNSP
jgi:hypothetical protein